MDQLERESWGQLGRSGVTSGSAVIRGRRSTLGLFFFNFGD